MEELVPNKDYELQKEQFNDSIAQVATATMMAQSLTMCLERKHLIGIDNSNYFELVKKSEASRSMLNTEWIKICQIGRPINDNLKICFETMQTILQSCAIPKTRLLFLIVGDGKSFSLYLGLNGAGTDIMDFQSDINNFLNINWTGLSCKAVNKNSEDYDNIKMSLDEKYSSVHAITGLPCVNSQTGYPDSVEYLMGGQRQGKMSYLVVAEPITEQEIDNIIYCCNEMQGQAESMKSFSFAESMQRGFNKSISEAHSITQSESDALGESRKDPKMIGKAFLVGGGLIAAGVAFPAILPFVNVLGFLASPLSNGGMGGINVLSALIPQKSKTHTTQNGTTDTTTKTEGESESYTRSITKNLVNTHIANVIEHLNKQRIRYEEGKAIGMWNVGCYLFSNSGNTTSPLQLKSILSGKESMYEPIRFHDITSFCEKSERHYAHGFLSAPYLETHVKTSNLPTVFEHPFGKKFNGLTTIMSTKELACLANFPLHTVPGINVIDASPEFCVTEQKLREGEEAINMGKLLWSGCSTEINVKLPVNTLSRHALVCGVNGSGKTNTILSILEGLMEIDRPFFVIEPAKTEYVDWAIEYNKSISDPKKRIKIFMPGCDKYSKYNYTPDKLGLNPFEVINIPNSEMRVLSHIDRLKSTFAAAFPMQDILPVILERLLYKLYTDIHQMINKADRSSYMKNGIPTLESVNAPLIDKLMTEIGYGKENTQNISAALRTRFKSLKLGWKKELLNNKELQGMSWKELFGTPVVFNLSYAGDDQDRAFIMSLLMQFLYEYRIAESETGTFSFNANECRHLVVVEEAHRIMANCINPESPQYKSGLMFSNMLSEIRAYGQGMMIVDQVPTRLIADAIKNTNIKIIHKLVSADDSQLISECIGLTPNQQKVIAKLSIGQAVLAGLNSANVESIDSSAIYLAQIDKKK